MSKALEAAHEAGVGAFKAGYSSERSAVDALTDYRDAFIAHLADDEEIKAQFAEVIADAMNMNRAGRLEHDAALAVLRTLSGKE